MDKHLFRCYMAKHGDTTKTLSDVLKISVCGLNNKINCYRGDFTRAEITIIAKRWSLSADEVNQIFLG